jgi:hypothetical protein
MKGTSLIDAPLKASVSLLITSVLFGCASMIYPDINVDPAKNNKATFQRDAVDCVQSYPESGSGVHVKQRIACMNLKGWR